MTIHIYKRKEVSDMASVQVKPINAVTEVTGKENVEQIMKTMMSKPTPEQIEQSRRCIYYAKNARRDS